MARFGEGSAVGRDDATRKRSERAVQAGYIAGGTAVGAGVAAGANRVRRSQTARAAEMTTPPSWRDAKPTRFQTTRIRERKDLLRSGEQRRLAEATGASGKTLAAYKGRNTKAKRAYVRAYNQVAGRNAVDVIGQRAKVGAKALRNAKKAKIVMGVGAAIPVAAAATSGLVSRDWRRNPPAAKPKSPLLRDLKVKADRAGLSVAEDKAARSGDWDAFAAAKRRRNGL